jgi:hypothetical protein
MFNSGEGEEMTKQPYPEGIDCVWLASDRDGWVGAFVTGGAGPIPDRLFSLGFVPIVDIEEAICRLPVRYPDVLEKAPLPDSFIKLVERGFYVFDWMDVHRTARDCTGAYERVAQPLRPVPVRSLSAELAIVAEALRFSNLEFAGTQQLDVRQHLGCREAS